MIIAVDFDGTLCDNKRANYKLIAWLKQSQRKGDVVILWTCREGERLREAVLFLQSVGFRPNYVNCNAPQTIQKLGDSRKVYADVYIDDKSVK